VKKANKDDARLISKAMNLKYDVVEEIVVGLLYNTYAELVMAVMICMKPLPLEKQ